MNAAMQSGLARDLAVARRTNGCMTADALMRVEDLADAYRLQEGVRMDMGAKVVGWKLAAPPSAEVISAPLFDIECMASEALLANTALLRDGVECELALRIDHPLPTGGCTRDDAVAAVGAVMPAFELLCSRLPARFASPREHIVADGMGQGAVVLGPSCADWRKLELEHLRATIWADNVLVVDRKGGNPFGDPLRAVAMLADHLARRGQALTPGTFVLAGSHTGVYQARPGERLRCIFEGLGEVALNLREARPTTVGKQDHAGR
jgi:2-keto-4-pentenoate hydratase